MTTSARRRAVDPVRRLRPPGRAGRGGPRRRRDRDPRRRHGRPLRPADHDGRRSWSTRSSRCVSAAGRAARRPPDDRPPRASRRPTSPRRARTSSPFHVEATPHLHYTLQGDPRRGRAGPGVAICPGTPVEAMARGRGRPRPRAVHDGQPGLGRAAVHRRLAGQDRRMRALVGAGRGAARSTAASDAQTAGAVRRRRRDAASSRARRCSAPTTRPPRCARSPPRLPRSLLLARELRRLPRSSSRSSCSGRSAFHAHRAEHPTSSYQSADERSYGKLAVDIAERATTAAVDQDARPAALAARARRCCSPPRTRSRPTRARRSPTTSRPPTGRRRSCRW